MPRTVLRDVALQCGFTWLLSLPMWGRCGQASLTPTLSYGLQPSDEGTWPPTRQCLVLSLHWTVAPL
jgi:hypothetical protein